MTKPTLLLLGLLVACSNEQPVDLSTTAVAWRADPLVLRGASPRAPVGAAHRLILHAGDQPLAAFDAALDPCALRFGGSQHNLLVPEVVDGEVGLSVQVSQEGNAMAGFSTAPAAGVSHHAKALFFATPTATGVPAPRPVASAAMSYRFGLRLEIVPMVDPLPLLPGSELPLQVRFDGPELDGATLVLSRVGSDAVFRGATDDAGTIAVPIEAAGDYLAHVVHHVGTETLHSTLTFHIGVPR